MKKILILIPVLVSFISYCQKPADHNLIRAKLWWISGGVDSGMGNAIRDTNFIAQTKGYQVYRPGDSTLYISNGKTTGKKWDGVGANAADILKFATIDLLRSTTRYGVGKAAITSGYYSEGDGATSYWYWDAASGLADNGVDVIKPSAFTDEVGRWRKLYSGSVRAIEAGIKYDGSDQTSRINTVLAISQVKSLVFDNIAAQSVTISGTVTSPTTTVIYFQNDNKIIGTGTWKKGLVVCDYRKQCFANTIVVDSLENDAVSVIWFGAVPNILGTNPTGLADSKPAFDRAKKAMVLHNLSYGLAGTVNYASRGTVYIPRGTYNLSGSVRFDEGNISVVGLGGGHGLEIDVMLRFALDSSGFKFIRYTDGRGCNWASVENIKLASGQGALSGDTTGHGIEANCVMIVKNVTTEGFGGHGLYLNTTGIGLPPGNSSNSIIEKHTAFYCKLNGAYVRGVESSNIHFRDCDWRTNGGSNFLDCGFLGNLVEGCHVASSGFRPGGLGVVSHEGNYYASIKDIPGVSENINHEPGEVGSEDWWQEVNGLGYDGAGFSRVWDNATQYPMCVPYGVGSVPANTTFLHNYSEGGTAGVSLNSFSVVISGDIGTGMARPWMMQFFPQQNKLQSPTIITRSITAGDSSFSENSSIYGHALGKQISSGSDVIKGSLKYDPTRKQIEFFTDASVGNRSFAVNTSETDPTPYGLTAIKTGGLLIDGVKGFYIPDQGNSARIRNITAGLIPPIAGEHVAGDIMIYTGIDSTIDHYLCTVTGTPGTWQTIRTGSGAWNVFNTSGRLTTNRTIEQDGKTFTIRDTTTALDNSWVFGKYRTTFALGGINGGGAHNYALGTIDTSQISFISGPEGSLLNLRHDAAGFTLSNPAAIIAASDYGTTEDSVWIWSYNGRFILGGGITGNKMVIGDQSISGGGVYKFLLQTNSTPIMWNISPQPEIGVIGLLAEQGGKIGFDGSLESVYMKSISSNSLAIFTPFSNDTLAVFDSVFTLPGQADYAEEVSDGYAYFNKNGTLLRADQNPFAAFYFSLLGTLDPYGVSVNDSTFGIKSGAVEALNGTVEVDPDITANENKYRIKVNVANLGTGTPTANKFLAGDSVWRAITLSTDVTGTLPIANGGTGQTTANTALNAFLPTQTGNAGKVLQTDGTNTSWEAAGGGLPALTSANIWVGNGSNVATAVSPSGDWTIDNAGVNLIGNDKITTVKILNANVTLAKIENRTAGSVIGRVSTSTGVPQEVHTWMVLNSGTVSAGASSVSIDFSAWTSTFTRFKITFYGIKNSNDATDLQMQTAPDGTTFDVAAGNYAWTFVYGAGRTESTSDTKIRIMDLMASDATHAADVEVTINKPDQATLWPRLKIISTYMNNLDAVGVFSSGGVRKAAAAVKGIKLFPSAGTFSIQGWVIEGIIDSSGL